MGETRFLIDDILENKIKLEPVNKDAFAKMKKEWDRVSKPIDSFGTFENIHSKIAAIQGFESPDLYHMRLVDLLLLKYHFYSFQLYFSNFLVFYLTNYSFQELHILLKTYCYNILNFYYS